MLLDCIKCIWTTAMCNMYTVIFFSLAIVIRMLNKNGFMPATGYINNTCFNGIHRKRERERERKRDTSKSQNTKTYAFWCSSFVHIKHFTLHLVFCNLFQIQVLSLISIYTFNIWYLRSLFSISALDTISMP